MRSELVPDGFEFGQRLLEGQRVGNRRAVQCVEATGDVREESREVGAEFVVVPEAALGHALHQQAARMLLLAEEARIHHRQPQQRWFERDDGLAHRRQQPRVLGDLVDDLAHQFQAEDLGHAQCVLAQLRVHQ